MKMVNKNNLKNILENYVDGKESILETTETEKPRSYGYWKDFNNVKKEFQEAINTFGKVPTVEELRENGYHNLVAGMMKHHGGYSTVALKLGIKTAKKPKKYWENLDIIKSELEKVISKLGRFPTRKDLEDLDRQDLVGGINRHGGINKIRGRMDYKTRKKSAGYWNHKTIIREANGIIKKLGYLPAEDELKKLGFGGLVHAINDKIGFQNLRGKLGLEQHYAKRGIWNDERYILRQARKAMRNNNWVELPSTKVLYKFGYNSLISAAVSYLGGISVLRERLGQDQLINKWKNKNFVLKKAREVIKKNKLKSLPSTGQLYELGHSDIASAIQRYHGGFTDFRKELGEKNFFVKRGMWKDTKKCIEIMVEIMEAHKLEEIPSESFFTDNNYNSFLTGIKRYQGGLPNLRSLMRNYQNLPSENKDLEKFLTEYVGDK